MQGIQVKLGMENKKVKCVSCNEEGPIEFLIRAPDAEDGSEQFMHGLCAYLDGFDMELSEKSRRQMFTANKLEPFDLSVDLTKHIPSDEKE